MEKNAWYRFMQVIFSHERTSRNRVIIGTRGTLTMRATGLFRVVPALAAMVPFSATHVHARYRPDTVQALRHMPSPQRHRSHADPQLHAGEAVGRVHQGGHAQPQDAALDS